MNEKINKATLHEQLYKFPNLNESKCSVCTCDKYFSHNNFIPLDAPKWETGK